MLTHPGKTAVEFSPEPAAFGTKSNKKRNDAWPAMLGVYFFTVKTMDYKLRGIRTGGCFAELKQ
jgi:hypothetical protein